MNGGVDRTKERTDSFVADSGRELWSTSDELFKRTFASLMRLEEQNIDDESMRRIDRLRLLMNQPASAIEVMLTRERGGLESGEAVGVAAAVDSSVGEGVGEELQRRMDELRNVGTDANLPRYIQQKLTTNFGPTQSSVRLDASMAADSARDVRPRMKFVAHHHDEGYMPAKQDFEFQKLLSSGAYGSVYVARHVATKEQVAIKHLLKEEMMIKNCHEQVLAETKVLKFGANPFVATMFCSFTSSKSLFIVMEYAPGGDLATMVKNLGCLPEGMARKYFAEAVLAVEYIHEFGIVHRDLKPDNLVISKEGHIKLIDFGLSKFGVVANIDVPNTPRRESSTAVIRSASSLSLSSQAPSSTMIEEEEMVGAGEGEDEELGIDTYNATTKSWKKDDGELGIDKYNPTTKSWGKVRSPSAATCGGGGDDIVAQGEGGIESPRNMQTPPPIPTKEEVVGTPDYIAPEVILANGCTSCLGCGTHVDWWAMGIILFELVVGKCPFSANTPAEIFENAVKNSVEDMFPINAASADKGLILSEEVKDLIGALLVKEPEDRIGTTLARKPHPVEDIKDHPFFELQFLDDENNLEDPLDWDQVLEYMAEMDFVPELELEDEDDTSFFDTREDRYEPSRLSSDSDSEDSDGGSSAHTESSMSSQFRNFTSLNLATASHSGGGEMEGGRFRAFSLPSTPARQSGSMGGDGGGLDMSDESPERDRALSFPLNESTPEGRGRGPVPLVFEGASESDGYIAVTGTDTNNTSIRSPVSPKSPISRTSSLSPPPPFGSHESPASSVSPGVGGGGLPRRTSPLAMGDSLARSGPDQAGSPLKRVGGPGLGLAGGGSPTIEGQHTLPPTYEDKPNSIGNGGGPIGPVSPASSPLRQMKRSTSRSRPPPINVCLLGCKKCFFLQLLHDESEGFGFGFQTEIISATEHVHRVSSVTGSAAAAAGMVVGSHIMQVNGTSTAGWGRRKLGNFVRSCQGGPATFHCRLGPGKKVASISGRTGRGRGGSSNQTAGASHDGGGSTVLVFGPTLARVSVVGSHGCGA
jgi:serine/threonine protein kinase